MAARFRGSSTVIATSGTVTGSGRSNPARRSLVSSVHSRCTSAARSAISSGVGNGASILFFRRLSVFRVTIIVILDMKYHVVQLATGTQPAEVAEDAGHHHQAATSGAAFLFRPSQQVIILALLFTPLPTGYRRHESAADV
jgi:hypothetical protein